MDQPSEQAMSGISDSPGGPRAGARIGRKPSGKDPFGNGRTLLPRRAACQISQPGEAVDLPFERWGKPGAAELGVSYRQFDAMQQEMPRP